MPGRARVVPAIPAGTWRAAGNRFFKLTRPPVIPIGRYQNKVQGVPLNPGQAQGAVPGSGALTLQVGPQGLGAVWYPAQVTITTTSGVFDTSTALVLLGIGGVPTQVVGTVYSGNGTVAVAVPPMSPGEQVIVSWTGANPGDLATVNVVGTMDALTL